jgi:hypothetical protein
VNLTKSHDRSEDAQFSFDGRWIAYKRNGDIHVMRVVLDSGRPVREDKTLTFGNQQLDGSYEEASAPFLAAHEKYVVFFRGSKKPDFPMRLSALPLAPKTLDPGSEIIIAKDADAFEYYPVLKKSDALFYARHTSSDLNDQVWLRSPDYATAPLRLPLNDCLHNNSDPALVETQKLIFSNNAVQGRYLLYIGNYKTGVVWNFSNHPKIEAPDYDLEGANYTPN